MLRFLSCWYNYKIRKLRDCDIDLFSLEENKVKCKVTNIYDADTCKIIFKLDNKIVKFNCRLSGIDAPEMKPPMAQKNREEEKIVAQKARNRLLQLCSNVVVDLQKLYQKKEVQEILDKNTKLITANCGKFDKYGRLLVELSNNGVIFNQILINEGYAYAYDGGTKKKFIV